MFGPKVGPENLLCKDLIVKNIIFSKSFRINYDPTLDRYQLFRDLLATFEAVPEKE